MNLLDILIDNYDLAKPQSLEDDEILILWTEITAGVELFKVGENLETLHINAKNYTKVRDRIFCCRPFDARKIQQKCIN